MAVSANWALDQSISEGSMVNRRFMVLRIMVIGFGLSRCQFSCDVGRAVAVLCLLLQHVRKEKQLEDDEYHKQLNEDYGPQHASKPHVLESVGIQSVYIIKYVMRHRLRLLVYQSRALHCTLQK